MALMWRPGDEFVHSRGEDPGVRSRVLFWDQTQVSHGPSRQSPGRSILVQVSD